MSGSRSWQAGRRPDGRQAEWARRSGRGSLRDSRRVRTVKLALAICGLVGLTGLVAFIISRYQPVDRPALAVLGDPLYRNLEVPPNAGAEEGNHIDLVRLQNEAGYLFAPVKDASSQDWNLLTADHLVGESRGRLIEICRGLSSDERSIVIYCGLRGFSRDGKAMLLVSDERGTDREFAATDWIANLSSGASDVGARILMLIDPGSVTASWDEGILAADFTGQLAKELEGRNFDNVCIFIAAGPGERSWRITDLPPPAPKGDSRPSGSNATPDTTASPGVGRSLFSYYIVSGLRGEGVDGSGRAKGTADAGPKGNHDGRITANELFAYVAGKVNRWATSHRGERQTVTRLGGNGDFLVGTVTQPAPSPTISEKQPESSKPKTETPVADAGTKTTKESAPPSNEDLVRATEQRLSNLWRQHDKLLNAVPPADELAADDWRLLQLHLRAAEQRLRIGLVDAASRLLNESEKQVAALSSKVEEADLDQRFAGSWARPFLTTFAVSPAGKPSLPAAPAEVTAPAGAAGSAPALSELTALLADAVNAPSGMPVPNEQALRNRLSDRASLAKSIDWIISEAISAKTVAKWVALGRLASLFPAQDVSPELQSIRRIAEASKEWTEADAAGKLAAANHLLRSMDRLYRISLDDPASLAAYRRRLADGLLAAVAAERWLILGRDVEETERQLRRADLAARDVGDSTAVIAGARQLLRKLHAQLPDIASWAACMREREPSLQGADDRYERLRKLSLDIDVLRKDAIALDTDWGTLRSRVDAAWSAADCDDASGTGADLSALILGERRMNGLLAALAKSERAADDDAQVVSQLRETVASVENLVQGVAGVIADSDRRPSWVELDLQLQYVNLPGFTADRREQLRKTLQSDDFLVSSDSAAEARGRWVAGTWHGFWSRQVLRGDNSVQASPNVTPDVNAEADTVWIAFLDRASDGRADAGSLLALRSDLAADIQKRKALARASRVRSPVSTRDQDVAILLGLFADAGSLPAGSTDLRKTWATLPMRDHPASVTEQPLVGKAVGTRLIDSDMVVANAGPGEAVLSLHNLPEQGRVFIKSGSRSNPVEVFLAEERVSGGEYPVDRAKVPPRIRFRNELTGDETAIIALLDSSDFPLSIQRVRVIPEIGEDRWRIRFRSVIDRKNLLSDAAGVLSLPPQTVEPLSLVPLLEFPAAAPVQNVTVEVQQRDSVMSDTWRTVLGPKTFSLADNMQIVKDRDLHRLELDFTPPAPAPVAEGATAPATAVAKAGSSFALDNGIRFLLQLDGKQIPPREIWPVTFDAGRFVSEDAAALAVALKGTPPRIEASVTASGSADPRLPASIPIELEFDQKLERVVGEQRATSGFIAPRSSGSLKLFGQIGDQDGFDRLLSGAGGVVSLNVGGLPRAYRWRLRKGQEPDRLQPSESPLELEFIQAASAAVTLPGAPVQDGPPAKRVVPLDPSLNAAMIDVKDLRDVSLRYYVHQFGNSDGATDVSQRRWSVIARRSEPARLETSQTFVNDQIARPFASRMSAAVTGTIWNVTVVSEPHSLPLNFAAAGRFEVTTLLMAPGADEADAESASIRLVIDGTAPEAPRFLSPIAPGPLAAEQPMRITCMTSDRESGIRAIELRVDSDGSGAFETEKDAVRRFVEADLEAGSVDDPWYRIGDEKVEWSVPAKLLPPAPVAGKIDRVTLWAVAENRRGAVSEAPPLRIDLKRAKPKTPPPPPTTGDIVVNVTPKPRPPVDPEILLVAPDGGTLKRSGRSTTFSKLKPGKYEIRVTQGTTGFKGQGEAKVTLEAGQTVPVNITVK